jgi:hypothetical protein
MRANTKCEPAAVCRPEASKCQIVTFKTDLSERYCTSARNLRERHKEPNTALFNRRIIGG